MTSGATVPRIVNHLKPFQVNENTFNQERKRYQSLSGTLTASEKAVNSVHDALEEGRVLIDIELTLKIPSESLERYPALAVGRLTDKRITARIRPNGTVEFRRGRNDHDLFYEVNDKKFVERDGYRDPIVGQMTDGHGNPRYIQRSTNVPVLPPELARKVDQKDERLLLLWEAEWEVEESSPIPRPRIVIDPALLEHIAGSLYAVLAVWDLSPIEAAALGRPVR